MLECLLIGEAALGRLRLWEEVYDADTPELGQQGIREGRSKEATEPQQGNFFKSRRDPHVFGGAEQHVQMLQSNFIISLFCGQELPPRPETP